MKSHFAYFAINVYTVLVESMLPSNEGCMYTKYVTGFEKTRLPHTSDFMTLVNHNLSYKFEILTWHSCMIHLFHVKVSDH